MNEAEKSQNYNELCRHHLLKIAPQRARVDQEKKDETELRKLAEKDGVFLEDIDLLLKASKKKDKRGNFNKTARQTKLLHAFGLMPADLQIDMFNADFATSAPEDEIAAERGRLDASLALDRNNIWANGSVASEAYENAYQAQHKANLKILATKLSPIVDKDGKPKGTSSEPKTGTFDPDAARSDDPPATKAADKVAADRAAEKAGKPVDLQARRAAKKTAPAEGAAPVH